MINTILRQIQNAETTGFDVTLNGMELEFSAGSITFYMTNPEMIGEEIVQTFEYPQGFKFTIRPDDDEDGILVPVLYDVILSHVDGEPDVVVNRIEMLPNTAPNTVAQENEVFLHMLCTFLIQPEETDINNVDIKVIHLERVFDNEGN